MSARKDLLFTFDATTDDGFMVGMREITVAMSYREVYKQNSTYIFDGKNYRAFCMFLTSNHCSKEKALEIVSNMINRKSPSKKK